jgi:predicted ATPase/DNA-binding SARP family transcriptional activator
VVEISVLGTVGATRDGAQVTVPGGKTAELLVHLALHAGEAVSADRLLDDLWTGAPTRRNTLQAKVARLRRALGDVVESTEGGYRLAVPRAAVDALRVLDGAEPAPPADLLADAGDWAVPHRTQLEEARVRWVEAHPAVDALETALAQHPYRERLWELLITALYQAGRQADALAAYQRARRKLADDLGLEPGPRLRELEREVLTHDAALQGNLPALVPTLIGRDAELADITARVRQERFVDLVGPPGIGKTAVAIAAGRALSDTAGGVWLVRLEAARTDTEVLDAVVAALGATGEAALVERLRSGGGLLILDNCEHVLDAAAALVERLLDAAPGLRILATSQVALGLDGEAVHELRPLALPDAVALFAARADRASGDVEALCRALDGLPLAIELAAGRTRTLSVSEIGRRLDDRFAVLSDPVSRGPERHRTLRATIAWSYDLLFPDDQRGLWALAGFADGAPLPAVETVLEGLDVPAATAIDVLGRLAARSLVIVEDDRYRLLDSIRAYAHEVGEMDTALAAQAAWYADQADRSTAGVRSADQAAFLDVARTERANLDAALAWCAEHHPHRGLRIATGFAWAWIVLGDARGAERLLAALAAAPDAPAEARASALLDAAWIEASTGRLGVARRHIEEANAITGSLRARADYYLAYVVSHDGDWEQALALTDASRARLTDPWDLAANALFASRAAISAGDEARSAATRDEVLAALEAVDDPWLHVRGDAMLGELARLERRFGDAVTHLGRAAQASGRLGYRQTEAYQTTSWGRALWQAGELEAGAATIALGVARAEATGDLRMAALARVHLGRVLRALGRAEEARAALESAAAWHREAGGGEQAALGDTLLAALDGDRDRLQTLLAEARRDGDAAVAVFALDALGGDAGEAERWMADAAHFISERDRVDAGAAGRTPASRP